MFNVGKSKAKLYEKGNEMGITFKDVAGQEGAKQEVQEIVVCVVAHDLTSRPVFSGEHYNSMTATELQPAGGGGVALLLHFGWYCILGTLVMRCGRRDTVQQEAYKKQENTEPANESSREHKTWEETCEKLAVESETVMTWIDRKMAEGI